MKKIVAFFGITLLLFTLLCAKFSLKASTDFEDFTFTAQLKLIETDKTNCIITWKTDKIIRYLNVNIVLPNNFEQNPYQSGRENCAGNYRVEKIDDYYLNTLEFDVYYHQLGNIEAYFTYSYDYVMDETSAELLTCNYIFVTGNWVEKQPIYIAVIVGFIITIFISVATYVIIENSRKNLIKPLNIDGNENYDDDNFDPIPNRTRKVNPTDE